jgi:DNA repair protein RecN (Recombination protein N)
LPCQWQACHHCFAFKREVGRLLLDIHGQHDNQLLMEDENHLQLLDRFAGEEIESALKSVSGRVPALYEAAQKAESSFLKASRKWLIGLDLIQFQLEEIESAKLEPKMDELLQEERQSNQQTLKKYILAAKCL